MGCGCQTGGAGRGLGVPPRGAVRLLGRRRGATSAGATALGECAEVTLGRGGLDAVIAELLLLITGMRRSAVSVRQS